MTVGKISIICWTIFVVMSAAFLPVGAAIYALSGLPHGAAVALAVVVIALLWWGPFVYAMYLSQVVVRKGDPRLLKRGIRGTAEVLSRKATNEVIQQGEFAWEAPRVYKYRLRVSIPGKAPYETDSRICTSGYSEGSTVTVDIDVHIGGAESRVRDVFELEDGQISSLCVRGFADALEAGSDAG